MSDIYETIGKKIRELRGNINQEKLAGDLKIPPNTLSRWETGTYKPKAEDLDKLARHFKVSITEFFPEHKTPNQRVAALTSATSGLNDSDLQQVIEYAEFRKARQTLNSAKRKKKK